MKHPCPAPQWHFVVADRPAWSNIASDHRGRVIQDGLALAGPFDDSLVVLPVHGVALCWWLLTRMFLLLGGRGISTDMRQLLKLPCPAPQWPFVVADTSAWRNVAGDITARANRGHLTAAGSLDDFCGVTDLRGVSVCCRLATQGIYVVCVGVQEQLQRAS
jgi:hypothetical protein